MPTPTGIISLPIDALADLVSASSTFQTWVSAANQAAAKLRVYQGAVEGSEYTRPFALVSTPEGLQFGGRHGGFASGSLNLIFEDDVDSADADDPTAALNSFANTVGAVLAEIDSASRGSGSLYVRGIESIAGPARSSRDSVEDMYQAWFRVDYGPE